MANFSGLRSAYAKVGDLVFFGRMLDKIRLADKGQLPAGYISAIRIRFFLTAFAADFLGSNINR
jgi:hypothetical protein